MILLFFSVLVRPHLVYCIQLWFAQYRWETDLLDNVQSRAAEIILEWNTVAVRIGWVSCCSSVWRGGEKKKARLWGSIISIIFWLCLLKHDSHWFTVELTFLMLVIFVFFLCQGTYQADAECGRLFLLFPLFLFSYLVSCMSGWGWITWDFLYFCYFPYFLASAMLHCACCTSDILASCG